MFRDCSSSCYINYKMRLWIRSFTKHRIQAFSTSFSSLLDFCNDIEIFRQIHARFVLHGLNQNTSLCANLINRYADLGHLNFSELVFESVAEPDCILYNTIIQNCFSNGKYEKSLMWFRRMLRSCVSPDEITFSLTLKSCSSLFNIEEGMKIHCSVVKLGFETDIVVGNSLVEMYSGCCEISNARMLFDRMPERNLCSWNTMINGYCESGDPVECFRMFQTIIFEGFDLYPTTIINLLRLSVDLKCLHAGMLVHHFIILGDLWGNVSICTALLTMYCKLGNLEMANQVFNKMPQKDSVVWNIMISAISRNGYPEKSLNFFSEMRKCGLRSDLYTALVAINSAAELKSLQQGKQIHAHVIRNGSNYQTSVDNALIDLYSRCGELETSKKVFDSLLNKTVVSWSLMIKTCVVHDLPDDAVRLYNDMRMKGLKLDPVTIINVLPAFVQIGAFEQIKNLHGYSIKYGLILSLSLATSFLVSYAKCGYIETAQEMFDEVEIMDKDLITWNSLINAYSKHGNYLKCFKLYDQMKESNLKPDPITFLSLLTACVNSGKLKESWQFFYEMIEKYGYEPSQEHYACLVNLLGRKGNLDEAMKMIRMMPFKPDKRIWASLLSACKLHNETLLAEFVANRLMEIEPQNAGNYVLLSNIYAAAGKWDGVAKMRRFLRDKGLKKIPGSSWIEISGRVYEFRVADKTHPQSQMIHSMLTNLELEMNWKER